MVDFDKAFKKTPDSFSQGITTHLAALRIKEEAIVRKKLSVGLIFAIVLMLAAVTALGAYVWNFHDAVDGNLDWKNKDTFPGKYTDAGLYKGDNKLPFFEGKQLVALYDPIDMNGGGAGVFWQPDWNYEENRNKEVHEIDNPVFLVAEYDGDHVVRLREIGEEEVDRICYPIPPEELDSDVAAARAKLSDAMYEYIFQNDIHHCFVADQVLGEAMRFQSLMSEESECVYLLAQYEESEFVGFVEVSEDEFFTIVERKAAWINEH